jgi:hypothetical protein
MFTRKKDGSLLYAPLPKELERFVNQLQEAKVPIKGLPFLPENTKWHEDIHVLKGEGIMSDEDWENLERIRRNSDNAVFSIRACHRLRRRRSRAAARQRTPRKLGAAFS